MKIIYFSKSYTPHDYRFLSSLSKTEHEVFFLQLESAKRQTEDRPVPENVQQILWAGGQDEFRWRDVPKLVLSLRKVIREVKPDLIHAGPIQNCAFLAALSGFGPILAMSWGYDLVMDVDKSAWMRWVTQYTLKRSAFFTSDAKSRDKAVAFAMNPEKMVIFPWGTDIEHFTQRTFKRSNVRTFTLFCSRTWESSYTEWLPKPEHADASKVLVIAPDGRDGSATICQDADIYRIRLKPGETVTHELKPGRGAWLHVAEGELTLNGEPLATGDGASTEEPGTLTLTATRPTEAILFDLN